MRFEKIETCVVEAEFFTEVDTVAMEKFMFSMNHPAIVEFRPHPGTFWLKEFYIGRRTIDYKDRHLLLQEDLGMGLREGIDYNSRTWKCISVPVWFCIEPAKGVVLLDEDEFPQLPGSSTEFRKIS